VFAETRHITPARSRRYQGFQDEIQTIPDRLFHIDIAEVRTVEGKLYLLVTIDRTSKVAFASLFEMANTAVARTFLEQLVEAIPYEIEVVLTDNGISSLTCPKQIGPLPGIGAIPLTPCRQYGIEHRLTKPNHP
jgi:hypothetical protein